MAIDLTSTYWRLHEKRQLYADDGDFQIVKDTLSELRGYVNKKRLHEITTDSPKTLSHEHMLMEPVLSACARGTRHMLLEEVL